MCEWDVLGQGGSSVNGGTTKNGQPLLPYGVSPHKRMRRASPQSIQTDLSKKNFLHGGAMLRVTVRLRAAFEPF